MINTNSACRKSDRGHWLGACLISRLFLKNLISPTIIVFVLQVPHTLRYSQDLMPKKKALIRRCMQCFLQAPGKVHYLFFRNFGGIASWCLGGGLVLASLFICCDIIS